MSRFLLFLSCFCLSVSSVLHAQVTIPETKATTSNLTLKGSIVDSSSKEALSFVSVGLNKKGSTAMDGISADSSGNFEFKGLEAGEYVLSIFYVGYPKMERTVNLDGTTDLVDMGSILMTASSTTLSEVKIVDFRQLIEQRPDGHVYNAEKDITNKGTSSESLLRKVPMVTVDLEGNVQLRGNGNVRVMIDGKPSTMIAASVKDVLKQIPADNIKSVEVITSPGAKYDAEGTSGVINIITKKNLMKGMSGSVFSALSYNAPREFFTGHGGFNLNYRYNKFGITANAGYSRWEMDMTGLAKRTDFPNTPQSSLLTQQTAFNGRGNFGWSQVNADYQIDSLQTIQAGVSYNPGKWMQDQEIGYEFTPAIHPGMQRSNAGEMPRNNLGFNAAYSKKFKSDPRRTLDVLAQYALGSGSEHYELSDLYSGVSDVTYREINNNKRRNNEFTIQTDYVHPLKKHQQKIEAGVKYIRRDIFSDYALAFWQPGNGDDFIKDPARSNVLNYNQQVAALYGQFSTMLSKNLSMIAGARYELTYIAGHQKEAGSDFDLVFHNVVPNLSFAWDLQNFNKLKLSYNMRIERPSIEYVNPFVNYSDQFNISFGNPQLVPEQTHNVELGYSTYLGKTSISLSTFYRYTGNGIESITTVDDQNVSSTTFDNIARNNTVGLDLFAGATLFERLMLSLNGNLYYKMLNSPSLNISNSGWQYSANLNGTFKINDRFSIAGFAMYNGNQIQLQGYQTGWYFYFLGLQTTVLKGKGTIVLAGENFFNPEIPMTTHYTYKNADYEMNNTYYGRGLRLSFNLSFGKMSYSQQKKINNDDLKSGDSGQPGMGGGGR